MKNDELLLLKNPFTCRDKYYKRRIRLSTCNDNGRKLKCFLIEYHKKVITGTGMRYNSSFTLYSCQVQCP